MKPKFTSDSAVLFYAAGIRERMSITAFVEYYSGCYYDRTGRWVESRIEEYLTGADLTEENLLNILARKTNRIDHKASEYEGRFIFTDRKKNDPTVWKTDNQHQTATAVTRYTTFDAKKLYSFFTKVNELRKKYSCLKEKLKQHTLKQEEMEKEKEEILHQLKAASPDGIGSVYLITFFYFITQGDEPIFDKYAMMALDAIYPDHAQEEPYLGAVITPRVLPSKKEAAFDNLLKKEDSVYRVYKEKLSRFTEELNRARERAGEPPVSYAACRNIDRALWVYGHLFRETGSQKAGEP